MLLFERYDSRPDNLTPSATVSGGPCWKNNFSTLAFFLKAEVQSVFSHISLSHFSLVAFLWARLPSCDTWSHGRATPDVTWSLTRFFSTLEKGYRVKRSSILSFPYFLLYQSPLSQPSVCVLRQGNTNEFQAFVKERQTRLKKKKKKEHKYPTIKKLVLDLDIGVSKNVFINHDV